MLPPKNILYKKYLQVEVADTPWKHQEGLQHRKSIGHDEGMIFSFNKPQNLSFWGLNTHIPLDIAFISNNRIVKIDHISPFSTHKKVSSEENCDIAIEANYNFFADNKIDIGDSIDIEKDGLNTYIIFGEKNEDQIN
tara:strand:- start:12948 stop:13358 length:411 start_codon:yes stop_codon:yes gene_type:complete